jgi:hypothetical protein
MTKAPKTRIVNVDYFADILVRYDDGEPPVYYWICQKYDLAQILGMGTAFTFEEAEQAARECLDRLTNGGACDVETLDPLRYRVH